MGTYIVTFSLLSNNNILRNYTTITSIIEGVSRGYFKINKCTYLVKSDKTKDYIFNKLTEKLDQKKIDGNILMFNITDWSIWFSDDNCKNNIELIEWLKQK